MDPFNYKKLTRNASTCDSNNQPAIINLRRKCKSLPNISIHVPPSPLLPSPHSTQQIQQHQASSSKGLSRPKILKKTWDKVKGIIHHGTTTPTPSPKKKPVSAPTTPQLQDEVFDFQEEEEDQQQKIARNYELLQRRLSDEFQRMNECSSNNYKLDGLSDSFRKRLHDWENWKAGREKLPVESSHHKELQWLDKQLEKIEREKKRLEREMNKYLEREARLEKMKEALNSSVGGCEIITPTAKCRVEKIDEKFAKKLYEWEEKKGVSVDSSGFGFLVPKYTQGQEQGEVQHEDDDDDEVVLGPLDLINARLKEEQDDLNVRRAMEDVAAMALEDELMTKCVGHADGRISSTASSYCSDYDHTDSKHSNTDSDVYNKNKRVNAGGLRRVSSDAGSGRSLSAFTSDDEEDDPSHNDKGTIAGTSFEQTPSNLHRDAESQTEVVLKAKQIVVDDDVESENDPPGVFVQTKRTIFAPVVDDGGKQPVVIQPESSSSGGSSSGIVLPIISTTNNDDVDLDKPVVVGMVPKVQRIPYKPQPKTQFHRSFPTSNKVPVWCSPLVARRQFSAEESSSQQARGGRVLKKYTIGGAFMPPNKVESGRCSQVGLSRSNSFRGHHHQQMSQQASNLDLDNNSIMSSTTSVSKFKSTGSIRHRFKMWFKSSRSGSRDDSQGGVGGDDVSGGGAHEEEADQRGSNASGGFSLRRIGSWVYKKGEGD